MNNNHKNRIPKNNEISDLLKKKFAESLVKNIYFIANPSQLNEMHDLCRFCYSSEEDVKKAIAIIQDEMSTDFNTSELRYASMELVSFNK